MSRTYNVTLENLNALRHALGIRSNKPVDSGGWRNLYVVSRGSRDHEEFQEMERAALVRAWPEREHEKASPIFSVTEAAGRLLGMSERRIREVWANNKRHPSAWNAPILRGPGRRGRPVPPV